MVFVAGRPEEARNGVAAEAWRAATGFVIGDPVTHFELQQLTFTHAVELEGAVECVRRLLVVIEHEVTAHGGRFDRKIDAAAPSRHVDLLRPLIANVAVAVIPEPVPVVVETIAREFVFGGGPGPKVVI